LQPPRLGAHAHARGNRAGALPRDGRAVVAVHQSVSGDVGPERVPAGASAVRRVRDTSILPASRRMSAWTRRAALVLALVMSRVRLQADSGPGPAEAGHYGYHGHETTQDEVSASPVIVVDTTLGTFAFETFPIEAPKTVAHIVDLVKRGFYDGQR